MIIGFSIFVCSYITLFPDMQSQKSLINPLQVLAQLTCFLLNFKYKDKERERTKHLVLVCFLLCILSSLYLRGIDLQFILVVLIPLFFFFISVFPVFVVIPLVLLYFQAKPLEWHFQLLLSFLGKKFQASNF